MTRQQQRQPRQTGPCYREETRLKHLFASILLVTAPPMIAVAACSSSDSPGAPTTSDAEADTQATQLDTGLPTDAGGVVDTDAPLATVDASCALREVAIDAQAPDGGVECGRFAEFSCGLPSGVTFRSSSCFFALNDCATVCPSGIPFVFNCHSYGDWCVDAAVIDDAGPIIVREWRWAATARFGFARR